VWNAVNERFYRADFNGVDWPQVNLKFGARAARASSLEELEPVIDEMLSLLRTSHTVFYTHNDLEYYFLLDIFGAKFLREEVALRFPGGKVVFDGIGIVSKTIAGRTYIHNVWHGTPADKAGLFRGNEIISVDGLPFSAIQAFRGKAGQTVKLEIQTGPEQSTRKTVDVAVATIEPQAQMLASMESSMRIIEFDGKKIAYVRIWSYAGRQFHDRLVEEVTAGSFQAADALIVDLRDGWGGASPKYLNLFNRDIPQMRSIARNQQSIYLDSQWRKPVALIVNEGTRSGKEIVAYGFQKHKIGPVIGSSTAGAVVAGTVIPISDESILYLAVAGIEVDGEILEGRGVAPDIEVSYDLPHAPDVDPQLDRAVKIVATR
jgi:carboxyl-terminal processing protease